MRKQSLKNPICICCKVLRCERANTILCRNCRRFILDRLGIRREYLSKLLNNSEWEKKAIRISVKCSLCRAKAVISYGDYRKNKKYFLCQKHFDRWMKIGQQLSSFIENFFD